MSNHSTRSQMTGPASSKELDAVFSAVSHAARRQIIASLHARGGAMTAGEIADRFKHSWPTTTRHLGVLETAKLLDVEKQGRNRLYTLRSTAVHGACAWLTEVGVETDAEQGRERPGWTKLNYGTMRNAKPPKP